MNRVDYTKLTLKNEMPGAVRQFRRDLPVLYCLKLFPALI